MNYSNNFLEYNYNKTYRRNQNNEMMPIQVYCMEPYVFSTLMNLINKKIVVETVRDSITGILLDVKPDHIVVGERDDSKFFIRLAQIVHIMPIDNN